MEKGKPSATETRKHIRQSVPKVLSTGRTKPDLRCRPGAPHADLLSRELEELRHMSIGSPVPTPRSDDDPFTPSTSVVDEDDATAKPGTSGFPLIKVDSCGGGLLPGPLTTGSNDEFVRSKNARRNSDTLTTPCHVPRSIGSKVVRYTFNGSEDAVSD